MPRYAVTFTRVVEVDEVQPLDASGRPPKHLRDWKPEVLDAIEYAAIESINDVGLENVAADTIQILDDEDTA